jgi:integrase
MVTTKREVSRDTGPGLPGLFIPEGLTEKEYNQLPAAVKKLVIRLSSPRLRSPGTLNSYLQTARRFFRIIGAVKRATDDDFRRYFIARRSQKISERTLAKEFYHLKKLAQANHWGWPFQREDVPTTYEQPARPAFTLEEVEKLIKSYPLLTRPEKFYLACSTIWGLRSIELCRITKRDYDGQVIRFHKAKRERPIVRLIPDELKPLFSGTRPTISSQTSLARLFDLICHKAKVRRPGGASFHAIRRCLADELEYVGAVHRLKKSYLGEWMGWSEARIGREAGGAAMAGTYISHDRRSENSFDLDKAILPIHPFLPFWKGVKP